MKVYYDIHSCEHFTVHVFSHLSLPKHYQVDPIIIPVLRFTKLRPERLSNLLKVLQLLSMGVRWEPRQKGSIAHPHHHPTTYLLIHLALLQPLPVASKSGHTPKAAAPCVSQVNENQH